MKIVLGWKAHSGWAALVGVGMRGGKPHVVDRRRVELVDEKDAFWSKQPYHAAESLEAEEARAVVRRGIDAAERIALREMRVAVKRARDGDHEIVACAILVGEPMPEWSIDEILAVHFRMHKAEGVLFRDALLRAAKACGLEALAVPEKQLSRIAEKTLGVPAADLSAQIGVLRKSIGPPWGKDQKDATLAAMIALGG